MAVFWAWRKVLPEDAFCAIAVTNKMTNAPMYANMRSGCNRLLSDEQDSGNEGNVVQLSAEETLYAILYLLCVVRSASAHVSQGWNSSAHKRRAVLKS